MKFLKSLFVICFLNVSIISASYLYSTKSYCIEDFYIKKGSFYYLRTDNNRWYSTTTDKQLQYVHSGFYYDEDTQICKPQPYLMLGMDIKDFNFLLGLIGVIFGGVFMFFTVEAFVKVGGKK